MASSQPDFMDLATLAWELTPENAKDLESKVKLDPEDAESRARLVGYYFVRSHGLKSVQRRRHALWFVEHFPEDPFTGCPYVVIRKELDLQGYAAARGHWLGHIRTTKSARVLVSAAAFFRAENPKLSERLLKRAARAEPRSARWQSELGHHFWRKANSARGKARVRNARTALAYFEREQQLTKGQPFRWYNLTDLARTSLEAGLKDQARAHAREMLRLAERFKGDWNYGNAIHHANTVLGRIALRAGTVTSACRYLLKAGETPGSPQLNSFGPSFGLARELLRFGKQEVVLEYLESCGRFWAMSAGNLERWADEIRKSGTADFSSNYSPRRRRAR